MPNLSVETIYYQDGAIRITNTHATFRAHTSYAIRLWSTSGEVDVLVTQDQTYTQTIVGALTTAIHQQNLTRLDSSDHGMPDGALAPPAH